MEAVDLKQGTEAWEQYRIGKMTSSQHYKLVTDASRPMTSEELAYAKEQKSRKTTIVDPAYLSDGAITYIEQIAGEIFTGRSSEKDIKTKAMEHGIEYEPMARKLYERVKECTVTQIGCQPYKGYERFVCGSPDGLVGTDGGIEIKCPETDQIQLRRLRMSHWTELRANEKQEYWQCVSGMLLNNRKWWDFVSYSPFFPTLATQIKIIRIPRTEADSDVRLLAIKLKVSVEELIRILEILDKK